MSEGRITLEIVTPKGRALLSEVDEVTAPSVEGEFGMMPGHIPVLAALRTGIVSYRTGSETKKCAVGTGFAEGGPEKLLILTDEFVEQGNVNPVDVRQELAKAQAEFEQMISKDIKLDEGSAERNALIVRLNWLVTQLELCGEPPAATVRLLEENGARTSSDQDPDVYKDGADEAS